MITLLKCIFLNKNDLIVLSLFQGSKWEQVNIGLGNELFEPMMTQIFDAVWHHQAMMR